MSIKVQVPSIILPTVWSIGTETENIDDLLEHTSIEFSTEFLQEKLIHIIATEATIFGAPGNLECWVELSPYPSANSNYWSYPLPTTTAYWSAIGGGGGALAPVAPLVEVATGVHLTIHTFTLPWQIHSPWARLVVQTPVAAALPTAYWVVQAMIVSKTS